MNKKLFKQCLSVAPKLLILASVITTFSSCNPSGKGKKNPVPTGKSVACFDYFKYKGEDDFYKNNSLQGEGSFFNPILPGWYSDPSICTNGEDYFLVTSTFSYFPGVPIFHSKDLINWKQIGHVLDRTSQLEKLEGQHVSGGIFAPAISYNPSNQTYYMITTNVGAGNFFVKTKDPFGSWSDPVYLQDVHGIDPSFFFDEDGKAYIVNNDAPDEPAEYDGHRVIRVHQFDVATEKTFGKSKVLVNKGVRPEEKPIWIEGPHMYKINGKYFLMSAEGGTSINHSEVILRGDSPMGEFKAWDKNPILTQRHLNPDRQNPITCAGHADLVQSKEGDWWAVFLACRPIDGKFENLGRETFMMPLKWSEDGFPYMTQGDDLVPMILQRDGVKRNADVTFGNFVRNDDFDSTKLGLEWMTLRTPAADLYSLTQNQGFLTLKCSEIASTEMKTPSFVCRRMQHHKFECETKMYFQPVDNNETAGILLFKDERHQYYFSVCKSETGRKICLNKISESGSEVLASRIEDSEDESITMKVVSRGTHYDFFYSIGDGQLEELCKNIDAQYLSTANSFGFTGTTIGMYATRSAVTAK